jgi:G3E family GTPase
VPECDKIPVTIVTGFLGAGKTTLVNHILKGDHGLKIAVVENEFGEVSIDTDLVQENLKAAESIVTMDNGCVCCSVRGDLIRALTELLSKGKQFDAVLVECTGLADPAPVAFTFYMNPDINEYYKIDSILALVDAKHVKQHVEEVKPDGVVNEAVSQIAFADRILCNKTDLVSPEELAETKALIKSINGFADIVECQNSNVPLATVLGVNSFSIEKTLEVDPDFMEDPDKAQGDPTKKKKVHDTSGVGSVGIQLEGELDDVVFNGFMQQLLQAKARDLFRSKGVLCIHGQGKTKFVFQGVHEQINFGPSLESWKEDETPMNKLVFIGRGLDREELQKGFAACKYTPLPPGWDSAMDDYGRRYYFQKETRTTQWTKPTE